MAGLKLDLFSILSRAKTERIQIQLINPPFQPPLQKNKTKLTRFIYRKRVNAALRTRHRSQLSPAAQFYRGSTKEGSFERLQHNTREIKAG